MKKLREDDWGKTVPVIMLTNLSDPESVASSLGSGVLDFLVKKDWSLDDVVREVRKKLQQGSQ